VRRLLIGLALAGLCLLAVGGAAAGNGGIAPPRSATESGSSINTLYWMIIGVTGLVFILVEAALILFLVRYRKRPGAPDGEEGPQVHGNTRLELIWTVIPVLILIGIMAVTIIKVPSVNATPPAGSDPLVVRVDAHMFYWEYTYPNGVVQVDELRLPVDRPVRLELRSSDVIHSWWVNELTGKRDAIPGRTNTLDFTVREAGTFTGQCAEFCGVQHAVMRTTVEAVPQAEFDAWLGEQEAAQANGTSNLGEQTWVGVCATCHGLDGEGDVGPAIAGNSTLSDKASLSRLLAEGQDNEGIDGYMPKVSTGWPEKQLDALIAYMIEAGIAPEPAGQAQPAETQEGQG
jgi:cytochrome c oxidase subunit 2